MRRIAGVLLIGVAGCFDGGPGGPPERLTALPRALSNQESSVISASNGFTLALFQKVSAAEPTVNVFLSPLSASMSLGMAMNGARSGTLDAMRGTLGFGSVPVADANAGYKSLISLLTSLDPSVQMLVANSIWFRTSFPISADFVAAGRDFFDAKVAALDFTNVAASKQAINDWASEKTSGRIATIVDTILRDEQAFLINAIYFKGNWRNQFKRSATAPADFHPASGPVQRPDMMHLEAKDLEDSGLTGQSWTDGTKSVQLPYGNTAFQMAVILPPDTTTLDAFVSRLTPARLTELVGSEHALAMLQLWMPRVKLEYRRELKPDLVAMGMGVAFSDAADFSAMSSPPVGLAISTVLQKTFLSIDEEGTEAAAVTSTGMRVTSLPPSLEMRCDRPYLIVIRERLSGTIIFIGKINTM